MLKLMAILSFFAFCFTENTYLDQSIQDYKEDGISATGVSDVDEDKIWNNRFYLATFPRSGNRWMRQLIKEATGITTTGSFYNYLRTEGSYEENLRLSVKSEPILIKTHHPVMPAFFFETFPYDRAVRIIRHPIDSFYSFYLFQQKQLDRPAEFMIPRQVLRKYIKSWSRFQEFWDVAKNILTIRYEDLLDDPISCLKLIIEHIGYQVNQEDIERAVNKYPPQGHLLKHKDHYTTEDILIIERELYDLLYKYRYVI